MTPLESMRVVAGHFNALGVPYAFLGAAVLPLLVDDPELSEIRPTKDVDLTVKVVTLGELYQLEEKLRAAGFRNDTREGAPICRWVVSGVTVDVMPTEGSVLGMSAEWFREALETASKKFLGEGVHAPVITPPCFLATKLAAFRDRGLKDCRGAIKPGQCAIKPGQAQSAPIRPPERSVGGRMGATPQGGGALISRVKNLIASS